jgi:hypothetical protein
MDTRYSYWIMQEPFNNPKAHSIDFINIAKYNNENQARKRVIKELFNGKKTYLRKVQL